MLRSSCTRGVLLALVVAGCSRDAGPVWKPGTTYATARAANARGYLDRRGLVHAHSVYSHDACDNEPVKDGVRDPVCFDDFRRGLCQVRHDFVMLTDHPDAFAETEFPDALLYRADRGDVLVERGGAPIASWAACPDGPAPLILGGTEASFMSVGLEAHVAEDPESRRAIYGEPSAASMAAIAAKGALAIAQHTEDWTVDQLVDLPFDGFEMYNLHANTFLRAGNALEYVIRLDRGDANLPHPDLVMLGLFTEDERYLETWGSVLARGAKRVTTVGTDCHRNTFPTIAQDGERIDSYRRMMGWFSNHLLVKPEPDGAWDDRHLKEALRAGRLYGAFEVLGYPVGFDFYAETRAGPRELGAEVPLADAPVLVVAAPQIQDLDPAAEAPTRTVRILRAVDGGFEEVARGPGALRYTPDRPGAYRAEVRLVPLHLREFLGDYARAVLSTDFPWVYANAIYVR
ncbi:hypothetical protein L6R52_41230 [Myxococcota bacterium]|nr:hypothetical protein [Myxococcota bacterium]